MVSQHQTVQSPEDLISQRGQEGSSALLEQEGALLVGPVGGRGAGRGARCAEDEAPEQGTQAVRGWARALPCPNHRAGAAVPRRGGGLVVGCEVLCVPAGLSPGAESVPQALPSLPEGKG